MNEKYSRAINNKSPYKTDYNSFQEIFFWKNGESRRIRICENL